jgi:polyphosphate glucokinase
MNILGIEYIGEEIRAGIVNAQSGELEKAGFVALPITEHTPSKLLSKIHEIVQLFQWKGKLAVGFPGPVDHGIVLAPPFLTHVWEDTDLQLMIKELTDLETLVCNGMDASAYAEMKFGAGKDIKGSAIVLSVGQTVNSSLFYNSVLYPNTDLGLIEIQGIRANERASNRIRKEEGLKRRTWAKRIQTVLQHYEILFNPDVFILCGEVCHKADKVIPFIEVKTEVREAALFKYAGIIGAAAQLYNVSK